MDDSSPAWSRSLLMVLGLVLAVHVALLWMPGYLPFIDWPNHLARHDLEARWLAQKPLPNGYVIDYRLLPNLGGDLLVPPLLLIFDPDTTTRLVWSLAVILTAVGPLVYVAQILGRSAALSVGLFWLPWLLASQLCWGFFNFYSGFGLAFLALAHLETLLRRPKLSFLGLALHAVFVSGLLIWHLAVWGIYGLLFAVRVIAEGWRTGFPRFLLPGLATVPSLVLCVLYFLANRSPEGSAGYNWGEVSRKGMLLLGPFRGYDLRADGLALGAWGLALLVLFFSRQRTATIRPGWLVPSLVMLLLGYLALPFQLGSTSDTDTRVIPALLLIGLTILLARMPVRSWLVIGLVLLCVGVRVASFGWYWSNLSARLVQEAQAFELIPRGSRVLPVVLVPEESRLYPERHFVDYGVVTRSLFVPELFAISDQQPLRYVPPIEPAWEIRAGTIHFDLDRLRAGYDIIWVYNPDQRPIEIPPDCPSLGTALDVQVYRVR